MSGITDPELLQVIERFELRIRTIESSDIFAISQAPTRPGFIPPPSTDRFLGTAEDLDVTFPPSVSFVGFYALERTGTGIGKYKICTPNSDDTWHWITYASGFF